MFFKSLTPRTAALTVALLSAAPLSARPLDDRSARSTPRARLGTLPTGHFGSFINFPAEKEKLGRHSYRGGLFLSEKIGMLYTCRAGFIDTAHLRKGVDWTGWLDAKLRRALADGKTEFSFKAKEASIYSVKFDLPADLTPEQRDEFALRAAQKIAHALTTWHEMLTWYGHTGFFVSERPSAFSYEDPYSNFIGTEIAVRAIRMDRLNYDEAVTQMLDSFLHKAGARSTRGTRAAFDAVKGTWWNRHPWPYNGFISKRSFDIGLGDGKIDPWVIPNLEGCTSTEPISFALPDFKNVLGRDLSNSMSIEIDPRFGNVEDMFDHEAPKRIDVDVHFPAIMEKIMREAQKELGPSVETP